MLSLVWCCCAWFGVVGFGLVWLTLVLFQIDLESIAKTGSRMHWSNFNFQVYFALVWVGVDEFSLV